MGSPDSRTDKQADIQTDSSHFLAYNFILQTKSLQRVRARRNAERDESAARRERTKRREGRPKEKESEASEKKQERLR